MAQDWDIRPRGNACAQCATPFVDRQSCFSMLAYDGQEGYRRGDFCETCWAAHRDTGAPYSAWQGVYKAPPPAAEEPLKKETAESLLRELVEKNDPSKRNVVYILAVMLERKRIVVERDVQIHEDGSMIRVYEHRKTGETIAITDPRLKFDQIEQVQQEVIAMLEPPAPETATTDPSSSVEPGSEEEKRED